MKRILPLGLLLIALAWCAHLYVKYRVAPSIHPEQFNLTDTNNLPVNIESGEQDYILVNFMATWCGNCINELPSLERLQSLESKRLQILCVSDESLTKLSAFKEHRESHLRYVQIQMLGKPYFIHTFPTTYLLNKKGEILYTAVGERIWDSPEVLAQLRQLIH
jgi:thiol-disulfide isomerase/thioredoxin